ncbi:hypothetical protein MBLNU230_g0546t1 [Neophaeotheca triangularis]
MGFLKHFRSKSRLKDKEGSPQQQLQSHSYNKGYSNGSPQASYRGRDQTQRLPSNVLENIFTFVCPHVLDDTYEPSERSSIGDGCMLCDLRDLGRCASVCRKWYQSAQRLLYTSVRIDAVHYCELEDLLQDQRKKHAKHFRSKSNVESGEVPNVRLSLFCRTVRESPNLATQVELLKLPYMTRETSKGDLARTVSALPNLRYVDLPDGFFSGDPSCLPLRQELQARCPDIRKMIYRTGSEESLEMLASRHWLAIETLEISSLAIEQATLRIVLASLPTLHNLTLADLSWADDGIFHPAPGQLPDFPPLQALRLENVPGITATGLNSWLNYPQNREMLFSLTLTNTGITVPELHTVLWSASSLTHLAILETVSKSLALSSQELPPLMSISLRTLNYEITSHEDVHGLQRPASSYYAYLASSLHQNALPALSTLYVRDQEFPELLLLPAAPALPFANGSMRANNNSIYGGNSLYGANSLQSKPSNISSNHSLSPSHHSGTNASSTLHSQNPYNTRVPPTTAPQPQPAPGFNQTLEVFSKGIDELEWVFTTITPPSAANNTSTPSHSRADSTPTHNRGSHSVSGGRPLSAISAGRGLGPQWAQGGFGGDARKSVIVGNGFGGFLAVPQEEVPRPRTSDGRGSFGSQGSGGGSLGAVGNAGERGSWLKPPPSMGVLSGDGGGGGAGGGHARRGSKHDLWR